MLLPITAAILSCAFLVRFWVALKYPNILWPDEIFQTLEPAHRLAYGFGIVTWEYRVGLRSLALPGLLATIMRLTSWIGAGSVGYLVGIKAFLCLLSLSAVLFAFFWTYRVGGLSAAVISSVIATFWYELIYYSPKAFLEVVAAHLLLAGVYLTVPGKLFSRWNRLFIAGLLLGSAVALRIHLAPAVAFVAVYTCRREWHAKWIPMVLGVACPLLAGGLLDALTWSYPFQSTVLNVWINVVQGKAANWGVPPWYFYVEWLIKRLGPLLILAVLGVRRSPLLAWLVLIIVLSHSVIAHKEYRFVYPVIPLIIALAGLGIYDLLQLVRKRYPSAGWAVATCTVLMVVTLSTSFILGRSYRGDYQFPAGVGAEDMNWTQFSGNLEALEKLSQDGEACGLGFLKVSWAESGGYSYLHRNVPLFERMKSTDAVSRRSAFNYILSATTLPVELKDYQRVECWHEVCLYKRPGPCLPLSGYDINEVLKQHGE